MLRYLIATQQPDGHWYQNQWLGGAPFWQGIQLDEAAFPVLLAAALREGGALDGMPVKDMIRRAVGFICREGPATGQDRWEEDAGVNTFTLAVAIALWSRAARSWTARPARSHCAWPTAGTPIWRTGRSSRTRRCRASLA